MSEECWQPPFPGIMLEFSLPTTIQSMLMCQRHIK